MRKIMYLTVAFALITITSCDEEQLTENCIENANFTEHQVSFDEVFGFDDFSSPGAALGVAINTKNDVALVVALKFNLPVYQKSFSPNCDPLSIATDYNWMQSNNIIEEIVEDYPYLAQVLTNTSGIRTMNYEIAAFLVIAATESTPQKILIAVKGKVDLTRQDGPSDILEGKLSFVEVSEASMNPKIKADALFYSVDNIYIEWDTNSQPD